MNVNVNVNVNAKVSAMLMLRTWLAAGWLLAGLAGESRALAQDPGPEIPPPDQTATTEAAQGRRLRIDEVVAVFSNASVQSNQVARGVVVVRGDARVDGDVDGDIVVVMGHLKLNGKVSGDVVVVMGSAEVNAPVDGELALILSRAELGPRAEIRGETLAVGVPPDIDPAAKLHRGPEIVSLGPVVQYVDWAKDYLFQGVFLLRPFPPRLGWVWIAAGVFLLFHLALALLFARPLRGCMDTLIEQPARSFLIGLLVCVLVGPVSLLLSFTVVATPLIWLAYFGLCVAGRVAVYGAAGVAVGRARGGTLHPVAAVLVGSVLFYASYMIPVIGFLVYWLVLPLGVGATLIRIFEALRQERHPTWTPSPPAGGGPGGATLSAAGALAGGVPGPATRGFASDPLSSTSSTTSTTSPPPPLGTVPPPREPVVPASVFPLGNLDLTSMPRVGFWPRFGANVIDLILIAFINVVFIGEVRSFWFLLVVYHGVMWAWKGTTLGGSVLGLRVIRLDGRAMDWQTSVYRVLGSIVSFLPLGLGFIWVAWDRELQSWHDRIAGTTVVRAERHSALV